MAAIVLDLRAVAADGARALGALPALDDGDRAAAIATWHGRMVNETISARVFAALVPQAIAAGLASSWAPRFAAAACDELRHGQQCAAVVAALGGDAYAELAALAEVPRHDDAEPLEALLRNVLSISCLSETVAVALIGAERLRAGPPALERTLGQILADEVQHARMGWELVEATLPTLDAASRARLDAYLHVAARHLLAHELAHLPAGGSASEAAEAMGVCDGDDARALFFATVDEVIVPRLQALGLDAARAFAAARGPWAAAA